MNVVGDNPTVLLVRHGSTSWNTGNPESDRLKGTKFDLPLNDKGKGEAKKDAGALKDSSITGVEHSPMRRSTQTAAAIAGATNKPASSSTDLDPWDTGYLSGMRRKDAHQRVLYYVKNSHKPVPGGESYGDFFNRFGNKLASTLKKAEANPGKAHVLVTHSCNLLAAHSIVNGEGPKAHTDPVTPPAGRIQKIEKSGGKWRISNVANQ